MFSSFLFAMHVSVDAVVVVVVVIAAANVYYNDFRKSVFLYPTECETICEAIKLTWNIVDRFTDSAVGVDGGKWA